MLFLEAYERRQKILDIIAKDGKVRVNELSAMFDISEVTIRMDLADLETDGLLSRVRGGAVPSHKIYHNMSFQQRLDANSEKKQAIAKKIASMVEDNDTIMLNSGTTTLLVLRAIPERFNLSIVTNSITIALEAGNNPNFNVVLLGGTINSKYQFVYGDEAINQLSKYHADKLILSVDGISCENGLTTYYEPEAAISRKMLSCAATKIIAVDSTKISRTAFVKISDISEADYIITDYNPTSEEEISELSKNLKNIVTV